MRSFVTLSQWQHLRDCFSVSRSHTTAVNYRIGISDAVSLHSFFIEGSLKDGNAVVRCSRVRSIEPFFLSIYVAIYLLVDLSARPFFCLSGNPSIKSEYDTTSCRNGMLSHRFGCSTRAAWSQTDVFGCRPSVRPSVRPCVFLSLRLPV